MGPKLPVRPKFEFLSCKTFSAFAQTFLAVTQEWREEIVNNLSSFGFASTVTVMPGRRSIIRHSTDICVWSSEMRVVKAGLRTSADRAFAELLPLAGAAMNQG